MASTFIEEETRLRDWFRHVAKAWAGTECDIINTIEYKLFRFVREGNYTVIIKYEEPKEEKKLVRKVRNIGRSSVKSQKIRKYRIKRRKIRKIRK